MSDRYKILGQKDISAGAILTELYSVPVAAATAVASDTVEVSPKASSLLVQALVTSIVVCNTDADDGTFDIQLECASTTDTSYLFKSNPLGKNNTKVLGLCLTLSPGDKISATCATNDCAFTVMGIEITGGRGPDA